MTVPKEERDRILHLLEDGQVTAVQAAQLLDALESERELSRAGERTRGRLIRVRATGVNARLQKVLMNATFPVNLVRIGLRLGVRLVPQVSESELDELLRTIETGGTGRVLDLQDMEKGERLEIFVE